MSPVASGEERLAPRRGSLFASAGKGLRASEIGEVRDGPPSPILLAFGAAPAIADPFPTAPHVYVEVRPRSGVEPDTLHISVAIDATDLQLATAKGPRARRDSRGTRRGRRRRAPRLRWCETPSRPGRESPSWERDAVPRTRHRLRASAPARRLTGGRPLPDNRASALGTSVRRLNASAIGYQRGTL
jgi:hypothetical protein